MTILYHYIIIMSIHILQTFKTFSLALYAYIFISMILKSGGNHQAATATY
nr:MAG TPA: hypothetical protein [Caudoviricetes sp.]